MTYFTSLERAVLDVICDGQPDGALRGLLATARVTERDNTGHGFFTYFEVDRGLPSFDHPSRAILGPNAFMEDMGDGNQMGFLVWLENGYPDCLEGFQHGDLRGNTVDLKLRDLRKLRAIEIEPPKA